MPSRLNRKQFTRATFTRSIALFNGRLDSRDADIFIGLAFRTVLQQNREGSPALVFVTDTVFD